jgi:hypothetical protein
VSDDKPDLFFLHCWYFGNDEELVGLFTVVCSEYEIQSCLAQLNCLVTFLPKQQSSE